VTPLADAPRYAYDLVARICREVGPGLPGTPQERRRGAILADELAEHLGPENVTVEEFTFAPGAFLGSVQIGAVLTLAAASASVATGRIAGVSPWVTVAIAVLCSASAALVVALEFLGSVELLDRFFPKRRSANVVGTLRRPGERGVERLLFVSGHHDSAPENTWFRLLGYGGLVTAGTMFLGLGAMLVLALVQLVELAAGRVPSVGTLRTVLLVWPIAASIVVGLTFTRGKRGGGVVPGAVDNLAASAVAVALCRHVVRHPELVPPGTEIRFVSFGAEEAGVRGSRRYVARHRAELVPVRSCVPTSMR
jgi:hypothetical protein